MNNEVVNEDVVYLENTLNNVLEFKEQIRAFLLVTISKDNNRYTVRSCTPSDYFDMMTKAQIDFMDALFSTKFQSLADTTNNQHVSDIVGINYQNDYCKADVIRLGKKPKHSAGDVLKIVNEFLEDDPVNSLLMLNRSSLRILVTKLAGEIIELRGK